MRCPRSPAKKGVASTSAQGGKEPDMGDADILRLIHHREVEDHLLGLRDRCRKRGKQRRAGDQPARLQFRPDDRLFFAQTDGRGHQVVLDASATRPVIEAELLSADELPLWHAARDKAAAEGTLLAAHALHCCVGTKAD